MADYNRRFTKPPRHDFDVHRPLGNNENLVATFTWREQRKVSKKLTFQGKYIDVWQYPDGTIELRANDTSLPFITYDRLGELDQGAIVDNSFMEVLNRKRIHALRFIVMAGSGLSGQNNCIHAPTVFRGYT
ncbi:hypothetical protein SEA27A368_40100 [Salmonella enterica]|nr:hypothetical protein SEEB0201_07530 [Salmonella enterica subsp. enterica serovar Bareilly str. CFSAN000201]GCE74177.1 hypothetical protein SEA27A368_40100 [Salmonella enterica]